MTYYTKNDEWIRIEGSIGTLGITRQGADELGDVTFVELPEVGKVLAAQEVVCTIESVKAAIDFYTPLGGKVIATNPLLADQPELLTQDPEGDSWMVRLELDVKGSTELEPATTGLLTHPQYLELLGQKLEG